MPKIKFTVFGDPISKRLVTMGARLNKSGRPVPIVFQAKNSFTWQAEVKQAALSCAPPIPLQCAITLSLDFYLNPPVALPKTKDRPHTKKPDLDNLTKAIKDALKGVIFRDDSQIDRAFLSKQYAREFVDGACAYGLPGYVPGKPRVEICVAWDNKAVDLGYLEEVKDV